MCVCVCVEKWLNTQNADLKMNNNDDEFIQIKVQSFILVLYCLKGRWSKSSSFD